MTADSPIDPIPRELSEFMEFFHDSIADVQFPDVDLQVLETLAESVRTHAGELAQLNQRARAARENLDQALADLSRVARRGLAYAKVYADGNSELSETIAELALERGVQSKPARKRKTRTRARATKTRSDDRPADDKPTGELPFKDAAPHTAAPEAA